MIPLIDLQRQYADIREEVLAAIERVCRSQHFILGTEVEALEAEIAAYLGVRTAVACASGTDALWLCLAAAGVGKGHQVITSPFSFFSSASAVVRAGAQPLFVDIDPTTLNLDPNGVADATKASASSHAMGSTVLTSTSKRDALAGAAIRRVSRLRTLHPGTNKKIRAKTVKAVVPVHLYGQCADMDKLTDIAEENAIVIIEDAAQAIGAKWRGRSPGTFGLAAAFSFYPTKNLSAYGDAGIVVTQHSQLGDSIRQLRNHGSPKRYLHTAFGWNARMDAIQAAVLRVKLKYLDKWTRQRAQRAKTYDDLLGKAALWTARRRETTRRANRKAGNEVGRKTEGVPSKNSPVEPLGQSPLSVHAFHQYTVRVTRRDELRAFLESRGIATEVYYPLPLHLQPVFSYLGHRVGDFPESERAAREVLALPMFPELREDEQKLVVAAIADFYS
ncbi:MAG: DegT/DnrJ/EryC1/StrS family aminotransferase [Acidobacteria bacterium]|nr:DegT/DnrJ/EryC1/StrS family aminotransferase [Acidobacteriota bacterium]